MKRIATAAVSALLIAGSMSVPAYAQSGRGQQSQDDRRGDNDRNDNNRRDNNRRDWNARSDNGFYAGGRWHYGQPTAAQRNRSDFRPGHQNWRRGERLPASYRSHYRQVDYRRENLRAPARGHQYVRTDRGDLLLVAVATGVIVSILANN